MSPGDMGGGIAAVLHAHGFEVVSCLAGRSQLTHRIAAEAGVRDVTDIDALVRESDIILSVLASDAAAPLAEAVAAAVKRTGAGIIFVDCNAIAPASVQAIEQTI